MPKYSSVRLGNVSLAWRHLECWGIVIALYLQSGATGTLESRLFPLATLVIVAALFANNTGQLLLALRRRPLVTFLLALPFLSVAWSTSGSVSLRRAFALMLSFILAYVLAIRFTPRQLLLLAAAALFPALAASLVALVALPSIAIMPDGSVNGLFSHKNLLGWHAAVALMVGAIMIREAVVPRWIGFTLTATSLVCMLVSGSATALLSVLAALLLGLFYTGLKRLHGARRIALVLIVLQAATAAYFIGSEIVVPALEALGKDTTLTGRVPMWRLEDKAIMDRPLLGYGYQAFWSDGSGAAWRIRAEIAWDSPNAHNGYRETLLSFGLVGFLPFMFLLLRTLVRGASFHIAAPDESWLGINILIGMLLVMNITESIFYMPYSFMFTLFLAAVLMIAVRTPGFYREQEVQRYPLYGAA